MARSPLGDSVQLGGREINLKLTISFLLPAAFMLLLVACGGGQPIPDIDATVEARVELAKASLVAPALPLRDDWLGDDPQAGGRVEDHQQ